ncbi:MAG: VTT domain-containing protein [Pseudomonadota bacterium]|nr:VTT domain-containing protein [Pseudomonadota bacterium]
MKRYFKIILGLFMLSVFAMGSIYAPEYLSFEALGEYKGQIMAFYDERTALFISLFILAYIISTAFALPTGALLTLAGGFFMGTVTASLSVVVGATIGAVILFMAARTTLGAPLQAKVEKYAPKFKANMEDNAFEYLLFLRLVPIFPFFAVNILPSLFNIPLRTFAISTFVGIIPGTTAYCYFGSTLSNLSEPKDVLSTQMLLAFAFLGALALVPAILKKRKKTHA